MRFPAIPPQGRPAKRAFIARDLTLDAAQAARSSRGGAAKTMSTQQIKKLLDSRNDREILEGLRKVVSVRALWHESNEANS